MNILTKAAATVLATAAILGAGAGIASAATATDAASTHDSKVAGPQYSKGFHIFNFTQYPMRLDTITGDGYFEGKPDIGSILQPGQYADFEVQYRFMTEQNDDVNYSFNAPWGKIGSFSAHLHVAAGGASSYDATNYGVAGDNGSLLLTVQDPVGTTVNIPADQAQRQADTLKQLCMDTDQANCSFTPTSETHIDGPKHVVVTESNNGPNTATLTANKADTVSSSDSLEAGASASAQIAGLVNIQVSAKYGHTWGQSHSFTTGVSNTVSPHSFGEITAIAPMIRDTGDFTVTMGNTAWHLKGVYFDSPDSDGAEHFGYDEHPLTSAQMASLPKTAITSTP